MKHFWNDPPYLKKLNTQYKTIIGTLNPINWDNDGVPNLFSIFTDDEEDIIVEGYQNRKKLLKLLNKRVIAKGILRINKDNEKLLHAKSIRELTGPTSPAMNISNSVRPNFWEDEYSLAIPKEYALKQYGQFQGSYWQAV